MTGLRHRLAALALIAGMVAASGASLFAQPEHVVCASKQHDCGQPVKISSCCCGDRGGSHDPGTPAHSRIELSPVHMIALAAPASFNPVAHTTLALRANTPPPRSHPVDLPTLFACLLI